MDLTQFLDYTPLFVIFIVTAVILWACLAIRGKQEQPPLISFDDQSKMSGGDTKARFGKKANEGKAEKQVTIHCLILFCS